MDSENVVVIEDDGNFDPTEDHFENFVEETPYAGAQKTQFSPNKKKKYFQKNFQNDRYNNAYGDYSGGYGPPGGGRFGPPGGGFGQPGRGFRPPAPRGGFGPPGGGFGRNFGPPPPMFGPPAGPPAGPPPPLMWGKGFGPDGPPIRRNPQDHKTIRYLMRCGVGKEHLKNLPWDLLQLMEPEHCGLCGHSFDSFATSRIHYISKNHLKSQKKWLNQQNDVPLRRGKEIALKARELYCELCDVHITSKSHSDSHYAGKPHRSIVEGRKNPKNPMLLQPGMEDRVAQLIRREKKHLKPITEEEEEKKVEEVKNFQPELYCDICKTSVTCSEQMTMHLNGKRHLSKEKQHILKMMKGGAQQPAGDAQENANEDNMEEDTEQAEEVNQGTEEAQKGEGKKDDNFDWGNGSGTWNDDAH